jgi:putative CocE/NonD family hydrolase
MAVAVGKGNGPTTRLASGAMGRALRLPPPVVRAVAARRGLAVRARDGVILRTDHYAPDLPVAPTVLVRTPYGRSGVNALLARVIAERGFHVVMQSCRGTGGSGGAFTPMRHERPDGQDTVEWLRRQPWFNGRLGTFGPSYLGLVQWAIADTPELAAMATIVTTSGLRDPTYAGESFSLDTTLTWAALIHAQDGPWLPNQLELLRGQPRLRRGLHHLPLGEADEVATGGVPVGFFRDWLASAEPDHGYWDGLGHHHRVPAVTAPVLMVGGWQDIFLPWQLRDYGALRSVGASPYLTIGPWTHGSYGLFGAALRESLAWLAAHLRDEPGGLREHPVRLYVGPEEGWRDFDEWPPAGGRTQSWVLSGGHGLVTDAADAEPAEDAFRYDPRDPTPSVGGPVLNAKIAGVRDNRALEARGDVLVYSSAPLDAPVTVIGPVRATVRVRATAPHFDVFARLCDVWPDGRSLNVCDGLTRVTPVRSEVDAEGVHTVEVDLWPAAHTFGRDHRIRLQVSGGAHPRYARNPGTGAPLGAETDLRVVDIAVLRGADPATGVRSAVHLPVIGTSPVTGAG